jgi:hypothetical protein
VFLGDRNSPASGIVELVDLGAVPNRGGGALSSASSGFLVLSLMADVEATLTNVQTLGLGGTPRRVEDSGVAMAIVTDPDSVLVELIDTAAAKNLDHLAERGGA